MTYVYDDEALYHVFPHVPISLQANANASVGAAGHVCALGALEEVSNRGYLWCIRLHADGEGGVLYALLLPFRPHLDRHPPVHTAKPHIPRACGRVAHRDQQAQVNR